MEHVWEPLFFCGNREGETEAADEDLEESITTVEGA